MRKAGNTASYRHGASVLCLALMALPVAAHAQTSRSNDPATQDDAADDKPIVVTAQRREQKLQDVGIAISALDGDQLTQANVLNSQDIVRVVPSLKMNTYSSAGTAFNIRGVSQNDFGDQQEPPIAVYSDDAYASSITLSSFPIFDVARVEVLRGPQGTLFGRNATGGAVQFISNMPSDLPGGYVRGTVGSFGAITVEGAATTPLTDTLAVRVAGQFNTGGNYMKAISPGMPDLGGQHNYALRGIVEWKPGSDFSARLILRYMKADRERQAGLYSHMVSCPNARFQGEFLASDQTCDVFGIGTEGPGTLITGYRNDTINPVRGGDPWKTAYTYPSYVNREFFGSTLRLEAQLGSVDLVSITDYQHATKFYTEDTDASPDAAAQFDSTMKLNQVSEELRLSGKAGRHQWVVGAYGMIIDGDYAANYYIPYFSFFPNNVFTQKTTSYAFFAQDEYELTPQLKLIGGLRYWHDQRKGFYHATEPSLTGVDLTFGTRGITYLQNGVQQPLPGLTVTPADADKGYSGLTARAEIDYKPSDDVLLYLSYNRGSKSGGFTFAAATPFANDGATIAQFVNSIPYRPETLNAYEFGVKATLGRGTTLNVSAFHYDYKDYQAFVQVAAAQSVVNLNARVDGVEADFATRPLPGLSLSASASFLKTNVKNVVLPDTVTVVDHDLPQSPGFSGSATARYEFDVGSGRASVQTDVQHSGSFCFTVLCAPSDVESPYTVVNASVGYQFGPVDLAVFVNNIFEEQYRVYAIDNSTVAGFDAAIFAKPRILGVAATVRFGSER